MSVHDRLATVRKETKLTQTEFAERVGVSRRAYVNYERGEREIPSAFVIKLYNKFSINPNWILLGKGQKTESLLSELIEDAVIAVGTFRVLKQLESDPKRDAKLVMLLVDYFKQDREVDANFVQKMLESAT